MGWPKGVPRKPKIVPYGTIPHQKETLPEFRQETQAPDLVLTVRRIKVGSFQGLWELCKVQHDGTLKVLTDANTKIIAANLAHNEVMRCGT